MLDFAGLSEDSEYLQTGQGLGKRFAGEGRIEHSTGKERTKGVLPFLLPLLNAVSQLLRW